MDPDEGGIGLSVPFRLDNALGHNRADVLLVMCRLPLDLAGQFTVAVSETTFQVTSLDITAAPFELHFAEDFPVRITDLQVTRDPSVSTPPGTLAASAEHDGFQVQCQVPIQVRMQVHLQGTSESVTFRTPFTVAGTIHHSAITLTGQFAFHLEGHGDEHMTTKFGTCEVILNAPSLLRCHFVPDRGTNMLRLGLAGREATLRIGGDVLIGLDGLDIRVLDLSLTASPLHFPGLLDTEEVHVDLDRAAPPVSVGFALDESPRYRVRAMIPARMRARLTFQGFAPQPLEVPLRLHLAGEAALGARMGLYLGDHIEVAIGDGALALEVETHLEARVMPLSEAPAKVADVRRALYAALRAVPAGPYGRALAPLREALQSPDRTARLLAVGALERRGGAPALPLLTSALEDPAPEVRAAAAAALGRTGGTADAEALLARFQTDPDDTVRLAALLTLAKLEAPAWQEAAQTALDDPNQVLRCQAALLIGRRDHPSRQDLLLDALDDPSPFVSLCAGMGLLTGDNDEAIEAVARLVREHDDMCVQMIGCVALGQTRHPTAHHTLQDKLETSQEVFIRRAALYALAKQQSGMA